MTHCGEVEMFRRWGGLFYQPRHQVDEIAGTMAAVELGRQYALPRVLHRARRAGEREDIGAARDHGAGARLDRRGADTLVAEPAKQLPEAGDVLAVEAAQRLGRHVAAGEAGAAGGDDDIDLREIGRAPV